MLNREIKNELKNKIIIKILSFSAIIFVISFILMKTEFFYHVVNYFPSYLRYYISEYLLGNVSDLIVNNDIMLYIEPGIQNIMSSLYLYVASYGTILCQTLIFSFPIVIFCYIARNLYSEINNNFSICKITRIGLKKYFRNTILKNGIISGLLFTIPRLCYFLLLSLFFPNGISSEHIISEALYLSPDFLYVSYNVNPYLMVFLDLVMAFIYAFSISCLSIIIISTIKNKPLTYLVFIFTFAAISIVPYIAFNVVPYIYYGSLFLYAAFNLLKFNLYIPLIITIFVCLIFYFLAKACYKKAVLKNI